MTAFSYLFYSGTVYLFFGLLIGENGFDLLPAEIMSHLEPVINFVLGWVGFIYGFQLEKKYLKQIHVSWYFTLFVTFFAAFISILLIGVLAADHFILPAAGIALMLAVLLSESSIPFVIWSSKLFKEHTVNLRLCIFISSLDNFFPILFTGFLFSLYGFQSGSGSISVNGLDVFLISFLVQLLTGILAGYAIHALQKVLTQRYQISTILFGAVFFVAGLSFIFSYSILFTAMVSGIVFSNLSKKTDRLIIILGPTEKPIYLIFLIFLGIKSAVFNLETLLLAIVLLFVKHHSRTLTFKLLGKISPHWFKLSASYAYLLLPVSSIAPAILLNMQMTFPNGITAGLSGIFISCFIMAELFAPAGLKLLQNNLAKEKTNKQITKIKKIKKSPAKKSPPKKSLVKEAAV